jgi:hypothetical protein
MTAFLVIPSGPPAGDKGLQYCARNWPSVASSRLQPPSCGGWPALGRGGSGALALVLRERQGGSQSCGGSGRYAPDPRPGSP